MLYYAEIREFSKLPNSEIGQIYLTTEMPRELTYAEIQNKLMNKVEEVIGESCEKDK